MLVTENRTAPTPRHLFGEDGAARLEEIRHATIERAVEILFELYDATKRDFDVPYVNPALDLFQRRAWGDLFYLVGLGDDLAQRHDFIEACLKREVSVLGRHDHLLQLVQHMLTDDVVNDVMELVEAKEFERLVNTLCPNTEETYRPGLVFRLSRIYSDTDDYLAKVAESFACGDIAVGEAIERIYNTMGGLVPMLVDAAEAYIKERLKAAEPNPALLEDVRATVRSIISNEIQRPQPVVVVEKAPTPPKALLRSPKEIRQQHLDRARERIEETVALIKPLTAIGVDPNTAISLAQDAMQETTERPKLVGDEAVVGEPFGQVRPSAFGGPRISPFAGVYGATLIGGNDD